MGCHLEWHSIAGCGRLLKSCRVLAELLLLSWPLRELLLVVLLLLLLQKEEWPSAA
jgi:hypothetical protein